MASRSRLSVLADEASGLSAESALAADALAAAPATAALLPDDVGRDEA